MELRAGYKQTDVGVIPDDWEIHQLSDHFRIYAGGDVPKHALSEFRSESYPYPIFANALKRKGLYGFTSEKRAAGNSLTITARGFLGHAEYRDEEFFPIVRLLVLEPVGALDPRYTALAVNECITFAFESTGVPQLTAPQVGKYSVAAPGIEEQSAIATALGDVDALLAAQDALIAKKRAIKQGAMQELLTGKRRLPGFSGEWEVKRLVSLLESPVTDGPHLTPKFLDRGVPFLSVNNLVDGRIDWSDVRYISDADHREFSRKCRPRNGDILFGKAASVGMVAYVDTELDFNIWSPIALIRISPMFSAKFVFRQLQSRCVEKQVSLLTNSSSQGNIGMRDIEKLELYFPSDLNEQVAIAAAIDDIDSEIGALETQRAKTAQLKQGMMQALLTGRIRLV